MQDRYVGDVGDFAKYGLLRRLIGQLGESELRLGVVWCLFPNETHNNDGRHVSYLRKPQFEALDDPLLAILRNIVASGRRCISAVSGSGLFPDGSVFYDAAVAAPSLARSQRIPYRQDWLDRSFAHTEKCDLVFFDPDNGLEIVSVPKHHPKAGKYIYWDELKPYWQRGQTLLIYHHLNRTKSASSQVGELRDRIKAMLDDALVFPLVFRRGSCRIFWLVYRNSAVGAEMERRARDFLASGWSSHFRPADWLNEKDVALLSAV